MTDSIQILEKINALYSGFFTQVIAIAIAVIGLVGILIPIVISFLQGRQFNREQLAIKSELSASIAQAVLELRSDLKNESDKHLQEVETRVNKLFDEWKERFDKQIEITELKARGRAFHVQAAASSAQGFSEAAVESAAAAIAAQLSVEDESNARRCLGIIMDNILRLDKTTFDDSDTLDDQLNETLAALELLNQTGRYTADIGGLKRGIRDAKVRTAEIRNGTG